MKKIFILIFLLISFSASAASIEDIVSSNCFGPPRTQAITEVFLWFSYILGPLLFLKIVIIRINKYKSKNKLTKENELT